MGSGVRDVRYECDVVCMCTDLGWSGGDVLSCMRALIVALYHHRLQTDSNGTVPTFKGTFSSLSHSSCDLIID